MENSATPFVVNWEDPDDAQQFWILDLVHCPEPLCKLDYDMRMASLLEAVNRYGLDRGVPVESISKLIRGFVYTKYLHQEVTPDALASILQAYDEGVRQDYRVLAERWENVWLPEIKQHLAELSAFDVKRATWSDLIAHCQVVKDRVARLWTIHMDVLLPIILSLHEYEEAYKDLFKDAKPLEAHELLGGFPNKTIEANVRLWAIGRKASASPSLRALLVDTPAEQVAAALAETAEGRALLEEIREYLRIYGERNDNLLLTNPTWIEDPVSVIRGLRQAVLQPHRDLEAEMRQQADKREKKLAQVRAALGSYPRVLTDEFETLLKVAQAATVLSEDHHFWLDCKVTYHARNVVVEMGRRLHDRGVLAQADDVFHLNLAELLALGENISAETAAQLRASVTKRRADMAELAGVQPPPFLGIPRPFMPMDFAVMRAGAKFNGNIWAAPGEPGADLAGMPGSAGKVKGPVRIIHSLEEATRLQPGDIMVAAFTLPSWTPFFAGIAGIVTNIGGMLCHAAVVAREYGIPAVVGTVRATQLYKDGQMIEVDGDAGVVRIVAV